MANCAQDQGTSRLWTTWCGRGYSHLLRLLPDFDCVAIGLAQQLSVLNLLSGRFALGLSIQGLDLTGCNRVREPIGPVRQKLETGN
jgi:hypothetical protein